MDASEYVVAQFCNNSLFVHHICICTLGMHQQWQSWYSAFLSRLTQTPSGHVSSIRQIRRLTFHCHTLFVYHIFSIVLNGL